MNKRLWACCDTPGLYSSCPVPLVGFTQNDVLTHIRSIVYQVYFYSSSTYLLCGLTLLLLLLLLLELPHFLSGLYTVQTPHYLVLQTDRSKVRTRGVSAVGGDSRYSSTCSSDTKYFYCISSTPNMEDASIVCTTVCNNAGGVLTVVRHNLNWTAESFDI